MPLECAGKTEGTRCACCRRRRHWGLLHLALRSVVMKGLRDPGGRSASTICGAGRGLKAGGSQVRHAACATSTTGQGAL